MANNLTVIVLAAGGGTRMKSKTMKVLHQVGGRSMIGHVLAAVQAVRARSGSWRWSATSASRSARTSRRCCPTSCSPSRRTSTAPATPSGSRSRRPARRRGTVLVAYGDTPLLEGESLRAFAGRARGRRSAPSASCSGIVDDPFGYGRVVRNDEGDVEAIVEEKDATRRAARDPRDQLRDPRVRRRVPGRGAAADRQRQRQGRVLPDRHGADRPRRRADRRRLPDRRRHADRGRQRPGPAGRARPRAQPPDRRPAGCATASR